MRAFRTPPARRGSFTLVELLVAITVLSFLILIVTEVIDGTTKVIASSNKRQDADDQARMTLDRIGIDIVNVVRRADLDAVFPKQAGNDKLFFYSEAPAYFDSSNASLFPGASASDPKNILSLIGYHINSAYQLERLGIGLTWDGKATGSQPGSAVYLSRLNGVLDPASTVAGNWPALVGSAPEYSGTDAASSSYWQVFSTQVFRLETCFLLKDGTLSIVPVLNPAATTNNLGASAPPLVTSDSSAGYSTGSRWFDTAAQRGYVCVDNTKGAAVWNAIGTQDLTAVVVAIALLDDASRKIVTTSQLGAAVRALPDAAASALVATPPHLMKKTWQAIVQAPSFAAAAGLSPEAASRIRIYQRYFYLNAP